MLFFHKYTEEGYSMNTESSEVISSFCDPQELLLQYRRQKKNRKPSFKNTVSYSIPKNVYGRGNATFKWNYTLGLVFHCLLFH